MLAEGSGDGSNVEDRTARMLSSRRAARVIAVVSLASIQSSVIGNEQGQYSG